MAFNADEEILQDFLIEAGEIIEQLSEQLVELERDPENRDLLNAIFRGFHTVKGGAGFLQLDALVECCHIAENVFDTLRNGKRRVDSELMDVVLQALDTVNTQFDEVRNQQPLTPADPALLAALDRYTAPAGDEPEPEAAPVAPEEPAEVSAAEGDITDDEFEALLDALEDEKPSAGASDTGDEITDDEFESLLDELHGAGKHQGPPTAEPENGLAGSGASQDAGGDITDDEFEALLDQLHGKGQFVPDTASASGAVPAGDATGGSGSVADIINDDDFESLLDELHGSGKSPTAAAPGKPAAKPGAAPGANVQPATARAHPNAGAQTPANAHAPANAAAKDAPAAETTVRVDTRRLDDIMNMVGELVLIRNRLKRLSDEVEDERVHKTVASLDVVTGDLQSAVMQTRMQPIKKVFGRFPRVVRDLARSLKKEINLTMSGEETDLDKNLVEALSDPLVHLVRNAVDHGIEMPADREAKGKPRTGTVTLSAEQEGDHILLVIEDDGAGMDAAVLRRKAVEKGLLEQEAADRLTENECFNLIFAPGFSTKDMISDVSGRGVGMDVVKTKISQLNGTLFVDSELGRGSRIVIKVPLTLAIMPTLMVKLGEQPFALPLVNVVEIFHLDLTRKNIVDGRECIVVRERVFPLFHLKRWLVKGGQSNSDSTNAHVVIVAIGTKQVGFVVDQLVGQEEVVIKPLGKMLHGTAGMSGATITGDGRIALIIDVPSLLQHYA
ncbi:chemotaxis protein CheA [Hydrocarboniclastica marina]|uniref:Chemotaxis protein CheA n=1 Tax=Hydrocarboniclastica marina TaxID=2259620 RepID=A0A4P7XHI4_9ALTE|nr:chemotaxis protein CheA [Hydrocarboniclastica marina]QCF25692.1 chemotaxis protein CheA [Hydrocarboniclastica marina]